jgi:hypothetical protein
VVVGLFAGRSGDVVSDHRSRQLRSNDVDRDFAVYAAASLSLQNAWPDTTANDCNHFG